MNKLIKKIIQSFVPKFIFTIRESRWTKMKIAEWQENGCPIPPPDIVKQDIIR